MWPFSKKVRYAVRSPGWSKLREEHIKKQPHCQACGSKKRPEVHHIVPVHLDPSQELNPDNLITLCDKYCHFIFGHLMNYKSWNVNVIEDSKVYYNKVKRKPFK